jgi:antitoxin component of MazEF toxin-antitoxin module
MITIKVRKQGSSAVITIPSNVLKVLNIKVGDSLILDVKRASLFYDQCVRLREDAIR